MNVCRERLAGFAVLVAALASLLAASSASAAGRPDPSFGGDGFVTTPFQGLDALAYGATVMRNGKVVLAGQASDTNGNGQIVVARYRRDGQLDDGFGSGGIYLSQLPDSAGPYLATAVVQEPGTSKLLVAGGNGQGAMTVTRLTAAGEPDPGFGPAGSGTSSVDAGGIGSTIAIQDDGRILLGGSNANVNGRPMVVARFRPGGGIDGTFGDSGVAQLVFWDPDLAASAGTVGLAQTADGGIVGSGHLDYIGSDGHGSAGIFKLDQSGDLDPGFGVRGHAEVDFPVPNSIPAFWFPCAMTVSASGAVTVTGDGTTPAGAGLLTTRLTPDGVPDPGFGSSGDGRVVTTGPSDGNATTCGAAATGAGGLLTGVESALVQLNGRGARRARFAPAGVLPITQPDSVEINAVARAGKRRYVVAGNSGESLYAARYIVPRRR